MKRKIQLILLLLLVLPLSIFAQPSHPAPIGGAIYLLLAGLGFGIFKLIRSNKK